jgi:hypothetical protein
MSVLSLIVGAIGSLLVAFLGAIVGSITTAFCVLYPNTAKAYFQRVIMKYLVWKENHLLKKQKLLELPCDVCDRNGAEYARLSKKIAIVKASWNKWSIRKISKGDD